MFFVGLAVTNQCKVGADLFLRFITAPTWKHHCGPGSSIAARSIRAIGIYPGGGNHGKTEQQQLSENVVSNPTGWLDYKQRRTLHSNFVHVLLKNQYKPSRICSGLATVASQPWSSPASLQGSSIGGLVDDLQSFCEEGQLDRALDVMTNMDQQGILPSVHVYSSLLKACAKRKVLAQAKRVQAQMTKHGLDSTKFLGEFMVSTLVKCGDLEGALTLFQRLQHRTVFSWTAVISGYTMAGQGQEALQMYYSMQEEGVEPNVYTFINLLKACSLVADLKEGKLIHSEAFKYRCDTDLFVRTCLIDMYGKCGSIVDAQNVFDLLTERDVVSCNAMLTAYAQQGQEEEALELYEQMRREGMDPNARTCVGALQACGMLAEKEDAVLINGQLLKVISLEKGKAVHAHALAHDYISDVFVGNTLVSMYQKCGSILDASKVFDQLSQRNLVSWHVMLAGYIQQGEPEKALQLYKQLQEEGVSPDAWTFVSVLQACGVLAEKEEDIMMVDKQITNLSCLGKGRRIHAYARGKGYHSDVFVGSTLVGMYAKCGSIMDAQIVFDYLSYRDVVSWNAMLAAYAQHDQAQKTLELYERMREEGMSPNTRTFVSALQACGMLAEKEEDGTLDGKLFKLKSLEKGKRIHADAQKMAFNSDVFVGSTLVSMYGKCGSIAEAQSVFSGLSKTDVVSWNAMLSAYVEQNYGEKALQLYRQMQEDGVQADDRTFVSMIQACGMLADQEDGITVERQSTKVKSLEMVKGIQADAWKKGYDSDVFLGSTLISTYGKCGSITMAQNVFYGLRRRTVVAWTAMLSAYVEHDQGEKALQLYKLMQEQGVRPSEVTLVCILQACSKSGNLDLCKQVHQSVLSSGSTLPLPLANTLIHTYGRCASMLDARTVFDALLERDVVSWNALIAGYAREGDYETSLQTYEQMKLEGVKPDGITFLSLLSACSHSGLVDKGVEYFESMSREHGITPELEHYASMVDLFGRAGGFEGVEQLLSAMPMQPNLAIWLCLLGACRKHHKVFLGKQVFDRAVHMQPRDAAAYVIMSNIYADAGLWDSAVHVEHLRQEVVAWKRAGQSWIEHEQGVHNFVVEDHKHPHHLQLYGILGKVNSFLKEVRCNTGQQSYESD